MNFFSKCFIKYLLINLVFTHTLTILSYVDKISFTAFIDSCFINNLIDWDVSRSGPEYKLFLNLFGKYD